MTKKFKPMLAAQKPTEKYPLKFPCIASPKIDGVRAFVLDGTLYSRSMKLIRNKHTQKTLADERLNGLDGELAVGNPWDKNLFQQTSSGVNTIEGEPEFTFWVFDHISDKRYQERLSDAEKLMGINVSVKMVEQRTIKSAEELDAFESEMLALGYEGIMVRSPNGPYKQGRATPKEGHLTKVKRFVEVEGIVVGFVERCHNDNEATTNELGRTTRSSHKENKRPAGDLGAMWVSVNMAEPGSPEDFAESKVGTGYDAPTRIHIWQNREKYLGAKVKFRYFDHGIVDKPRHAVFVGFIDPDDTSED